MPVLPIAQVQSGDRLGREVQTGFGNLLFPEGRVLGPRDLEILQAYLIPSVDIRRAGLSEVEAAEEEEQQQETSSPLTPLQQAFSRMEKLMKVTFQMMSPGQRLPILDIRNGLKELLERIADYHALTFVPPQEVAIVPWIRNSILTALTSYQLARWMRMPEKDLVPAALAGLLHDIGNTRVDPAIFRKPGRLTPEEVNEMRQHTVYGFRMLEGVASLNQGVSLAALQHHERIDGSGYPMRVTGDRIHPYARVVAVADVYHAMTSTRTHREAQSPYLVLEELQAEAFGKLDPLMVQTFVEKTTQFQSGMLVQLNDNRVGEVVFTDRQHPTRPMVSIFGEIVNLAQTRDLYICAIYSP
ncbi:HD-GYP domain-containing protein [Cohnella sp. REN36]|uniref:HD-GYP domain-containing protein n=1 Tax=Cohnella sp. REN36 TaxID=2887347 RepID=UPI001D13EC81|nr:HD-GYP domain-containing protein [Cohnella sp. REN36]MCC3376762.1 HD-GYP domain-containing protein [Cohnella sp. REN36]